jgi:hypothetical protein
MIRVESSGGRRLTLMMVCLASALAAVVAINWIVNPYGVWRTTVVDRAYRLIDAAADEAGERLSTPYRIRAEQPSTLLVGSSRVLRGMLVAQSGHDTFLNASLSGATFAELAILLRLATANPRLQRVIWGVDFYAFDERFVGFRHPETRKRLEVDERHVLALQMRETLFTMRALRDSSRVLMKAARGDKPESLANPVPWPEHLIKERLASVSRRGLGQAREATIKGQLQNWIVSYVDYRRSSPLVTLFQEAVVDLRRTGLEVILFVPPLSGCELETIDQAGEWDTFQDWKRDLVGVGPYWDFSGYGKLDLSPGLFTDVPHFKPEVGQVILRRLLGMDCSGCGETARTIWDAGVWVDATTVDAYLARQDATRTAIRRQSTACAKVVEGILGVRATSPFERRAKGP